MINAYWHHIHHALYTYFLVSKEQTVLGIINKQSIEPKGGMSLLKSNPYDRL